MVLGVYVCKKSKYISKHVKGRSGVLREQVRQQLYHQGKDNLRRGQIIEYYKK